MKLENIERAALLAKRLRNLNDTLKTLKYNQKYGYELIIRKSQEQDVELGDALPKEFKDYVISTHIAIIENQITDVSKEIESL